MQISRTLARFVLVAGLMMTGSAAAQDTDWAPIDESAIPPEPKESPPPLPAAPPPPTADEMAPPLSESRPASPPPAAGQWVYTAQYGWIWMPYTDRYFHVAADGTLAYAYVYYPSYGWSWVLAPWVLGWGPSPYWGRPGVVYFAWHTRPWFRIGARWRGPAWGARIQHGRPVVQPQPAPSPRDRGRDRAAPPGRDRRGPEPRQHGSKHGGGRK